MDKLLKQLKEYEEILKFYAHEENYLPSLFGNIHAAPAQLDKGEYAREVLDKYKGGNNN